MKADKMAPLLAQLRIASSRIRTMEAVIKCLVHLHGTQMIPQGLPTKVNDMTLRVEVEDGQTKLWLQPKVEVEVTDATT